MDGREQAFLSCLVLSACWAKGLSGSMEHPPSLRPTAAAPPILGPKEGQENPLCSGQTVQSLVAIAATAISFSSEWPGLRPWEAGSRGQLCMWGV